MELLSELCAEFLRGVGEFVCEHCKFEDWSYEEEEEEEEEKTDF